MGGCKSRKVECVSSTTLVRFHLMCNMCAHVCGLCMCLCLLRCFWWIPLLTFFHYPSMFPSPSHLPHTHTHTHTTISLLFVLRLLQRPLDNPPSTADGAGSGGGGKRARGANGASIEASNGGGKKQHQGGRKKGNKRGHGESGVAAGHPSTDNFRVHSHLRPLLSVDFVGPSEMVVVEQQWLQTMAHFPDAPFRERYGT